MPTPAIVDFRRSMKGEESPVAAEKVVKGEPKTLVKNYFSDPTGQFFAGTWSSSVGKWKIEYTENEFCHLLEGRVDAHLGGGQALAVQRRRRLGHPGGLQGHLGVDRAGPQALRDLRGRQARVLSPIPTPSRR